MARNPESGNLHSMSRLAESSYGTPRPWGVGAYVRANQTDFSRWSFPSNKEDDAGEAHGSDLAENVWSTMNDATKSLPQRFNFQEIGRLLQMTFGVVDTEENDTMFDHTFTPMTGAAGQLPSRTFLEQSSGNIYRVPGVCVNQLTISGAVGAENKGQLQVSADLMGSGAFTKNPASYVDPGKLLGLVYGYNHFASLTLNDGDPFTEKCDLLNWQWQFANNLQPQTGCGNEFESGSPAKGLVKDALLVGTRQYTFTFTFYEKTNDRTLGWVKDNTVVNITNNILHTGADDPNFKLALNHTRGILESVERTSGNTFNTVTGQVRLLSDDGSIPFEAVLTNDLESYVV